MIYEMGLTFNEKTDNIKPDLIKKLRPVRNFFSLMPGFI